MAPVNHRIRRGTQADAFALSQLAAAAFPLACPPGADPVAIAQHLATQLDPAHFSMWAASDQHILLVAQFTGRHAATPGNRLFPNPRPVATTRRRLVGANRYGKAPSPNPSAPPDGIGGFALVAPGSPANPAVRVRRPWELSKIYVHPSLHGSGIASALMLAAISGTQEQCGADALWLGTNSGNTRARSFYKKHGFTVIGTRQFVVGGQVHDDVVMECRFG